MRFFSFTIVVRVKFDSSFCSVSIREYNILEREKKKRSTYCNLFFSLNKITGHLKTTTNLLNTVLPKFNNFVVVVMYFGLFCSSYRKLRNIFYNYYKMMLCCWLSFYLCVILFLFLKGKKWTNEYLTLFCSCLFTI